LLPELIASLGFDVEPALPQIALTSTEREAGKYLLKMALGSDFGPCVGVFVGARARHGKRWPLSNFSELAGNLKNRGIQTVLFVGPEEEHLVDFLKDALIEDIPVIFERSLRIFAAMLSHCRLFVSCDSGPMHLACAVGVRTLAIFQNPHFDRWAPPVEAARVLYDDQGFGAAEVEAACIEELTQ
jgi:heptosyltransferase-3